MKRRANLNWLLKKRKRLRGDQRKQSDQLKTPVLSDWQMLRALQKKKR